MIDYEKALVMMAALRLEASPVVRPLSDAAGLTLAQDLVAKIPSPPYTNAAMDGFAVKRAEAAQELRVKGAVYARAMEPNDVPAYEPGHCVRIMTGGCVPEWADTVIPIEDAVVTQAPDGAERVRFPTVPEQGANIRVVGDDVQAGSPLLKAGTKLDPERLMLCAAFGHAQVSVFEGVRIALLSTGDELREPGEELPPGAVYDSSKYFLSAAARELGLPVLPHVRISDDEGEATAVVERLLADGAPTVLLSTGAVSAGELDFIPKLAARLGFEALFHKVAIRPGKPVFLAQKARCIWLGLPGNPISTCVGWHMFARPLLAACAGAPAPVRKLVSLSNTVEKPEPLRCFYRAELNGDKAWVSRRQGSAHLAASAAVGCYVELPEGKAKYATDSKVMATIL